jgi:hypothetical protein
MFDFSGVVQQLQNQKVELESQLQKVTSAVEALKGMGNKNGALRVASGSSRVISVAARKRIAAAQKARWAKWRANNKKAA